MEIRIQKPSYSLAFRVTEHGATILSGDFAGVSLLETSLFNLYITDVTENKSMLVKTLDGWEKVSCRQFGDSYKFYFRNPEGVGDLMVIYTANCDDTGVSWECEVVNDADFITVDEITYPTPRVSGDPLDLFLPDQSGRHIENVGNAPFSHRFDYIWTYAAMQYYAYFGEKGGIYLGVEDPDAGMKRYVTETGNGEAFTEIVYPAINAGRVANSFKLGGIMRWQAFLGDWYDATLIYADFVYKKANWLPEIDENGRPDTPKKYKDIPFWVSDYIPNSPAQRDVGPKILGSVSKLYDKNYWFEAPIQLKKELGTPIAYHVYNWHEIPFNIDYPHYTPARPEYFRGIDALKENDVYVMPYINAVSWEKHDKDEGYSVNYENTGRFGGVIKADGSTMDVPYPQKKLSGKDTQLVPMCPTYHKWHKIIEDETREIEKTMKVNGIYFDQIAAYCPYPCRAQDHGHLPGGGSYWSDYYNLMMSKIRADKPEDAFYFSECNCETYMKSFDGLLTWLWQSGDCVPAFPVVYAGYVQMVGRFTDGVNREDEALFRFHMASALLYGQQLGWLNANLVYNEKRLSFLKEMVQLRYKHSDLFCRARMLRMPKVETNLAPVVSSGVTMKMVMSAGWQERGSKKTTVFLINAAEEAASATIFFSLSEYGVEKSALPKDFRLEGDTVVGSFTLGSGEYRVWEF